jgi:hypothetical protein
MTEPRPWEGAWARRRGTRLWHRFVAWDAKRGHVARCGYTLLIVTAVPRDATYVEHNPFSTFPGAAPGERAIAAGGAIRLPQPVEWTRGPRVDRRCSDCQWPAA